jgi:cysteinyl-tRNA synthetase
VFGAGSEVSIDELRTAAFGRDGARDSTLLASDGDGDAAPGSAASDTEEAFDEALARLDLAAAVRSLLVLDDRVSAAGPSRNGARPDARAPLRSMLGRLAEAAETVGQRAELVGPLTDALVEIRRVARRDRDWAAADAIRDTLRAVGIELQDVDEATTWSLPKT